MNLIISFSGRAKGNCDSIAEFIANPGDEIIYFRDKEIHGCSNCQYECFAGECKYREDDIYGIYESMLKVDKVIWIVPMYCGNPSSLYFIFQERCQDFFMNYEDKYEDILSRLYIIGVYGKQENSPDFIPCLEKWFAGLPYENRVLGIERHKYNQKLMDSVLAVEDVKAELKKFLANSLMD